MDIQLLIGIIATIVSAVHSQGCIEPIDVAFIIDSSISIRENNPPDGSYDNWQLIKEFVNRTVSQLQVGSDQSHVSVVHYATSVHTRQVLELREGHSAAVVSRRIDELEYLDGNTNTAAALAYLTDSVFGGSDDRRDVNDYAVLITDGLSNIQPERTVREAVRAKNSGIHIFTIGVTNFADESELAEIASDPTGFYYLHVDFYTKLNSVVDQLLGRICTAGPPPVTPCRNGRIDVGIMMDESGSIIDRNPPNTEELHNWNVMKNFVSDIIRGLAPIGPDAARVSVSKFSEYTRVKFLFDEYDNADDMVRAVQQFDHRSGSTNISGALHVLRTQVFDVDRGDRSDAQKIGILITDGQSTVEEDKVNQEAALLKQAGVRMFSLGITDDVNIDELTAIASSPSDEHIYQTETIQDVSDLTDRLVWGVCNDGPTCEGDTCNEPGAGRCVDWRNFQWVHHADHLILGHNHARLQKVQSAADCQSNCLKDPSCKSVDYISFAEECSISYVNRADEPMAFVASTDADYYEWVCEGETDTDSMPRRPGSSGGEGQDNSDEDSSSAHRQLLHSLALILTSAVVMWTMEL